ncbi:hypothetical protein ACVIGB_008684 [Bradyrhizobium sp. USDA 4341]
MAASHGRRLICAAAVIRWSKEDDADPTYAVEKLIAAGRARAALHFIGYHLHDGRKFASDLLTRALFEAVRQPVEGELDMNDRTMFQHYAQEIFKRLDEADDVSTKTLAQLEWQYLPMFEHSPRKTKAIMSELAINPDLFVQLITAIFRPSQDSGVVDPSRTRSRPALLRTRLIGCCGCGM